MRMLYPVALLLVFTGNVLVAEASLPGTKFVALDGSAHSLAELGGHVSVINFWTTWCGPCREEMPRLQKLADEYQTRGVTFVAVSLDEDETRAKIPKFVRGTGLRMMVWQGASAETLKQLDLGVFVPATLILDEHGNVVGRIEGEARDKDIRSRLDWLLRGRQGKQPKVVQKNDW